jgi:hypothetical protein
VIGQQNGTISNTVHFSQCKLSCFPHVAFSVERFRISLQFGAPTVGIVKFNDVTMDSMIEIVDLHQKISKIDHFFMRARDAARNSALRNAILQTALYNAFVERFNFTRH